MIVTLMRLLGLFLAGLLMTACSGTKVVESWSSPDLKGQIENVYIIGISKSDFNRMHFENTFYNKLRSESLKSIPSSTDLPKNQETDRETIIQKMKINNCDSVLLTRVVGQRTKAAFASSTGSFRYVSTKVPGYSKYKDVRDDSWSSYYTTGYQSVYQAPTNTELIVLTIESVLYDLQTEELIWWAQMETEFEGDFENMVQKYVDEAIKDLKKKEFL